MGQEERDSYEEVRKRLEVRLPDDVRLSRLPNPNAIQITVGTARIQDFAALLSLLVDLDVDIVEIKPVFVDRR